MKQIDAASLREELANLYGDLSKHSNYQSIPRFVANAIDYHVNINESWRGDRVRLEYIRSRLPVNTGSWGDFGANTGYFSLSLAQENPGLRVFAIEANRNHASFIRRIVSAFKLDNIEVIEKPIGIADLASLPRFDVLLHLNVLHHAGADFDTGLVTGPSDFVTYASRYLHRLLDCTDTLVFQIGTNLWGDKSLPIIDFQKDAAKLELLFGLLVDAGWRVDEVAYAVRNKEDSIGYVPLPQACLQPGTTAQLVEALEPFNLANHTGEFYRRPLFIASRVDLPPKTVPRTHGPR